MPYPGLLHPEPLPLRQATANPYHHRRHSNIQRQDWFSSVSVGSSGVHKVLFEPSKCLCQVWGLILNSVSPLIPSFWGFSFAFGCGYLLVGVSFLSTVVQQQPVILEFSQEKINTCPSTLPSCKPGSKRQRRKGKIYPFKCRIPKNSKERQERLPQ